MSSMVNSQALYGQCDVMHGLQRGFILDVQVRMSHITSGFLE